MGDIINSRGLSDEARIRVTQAAKSVFDRISTRYRGSFMAELGMVRGDSFECVLLSQHLAPQIVQDIIKAFYRVEKTLVRIAVVMGQVTVASSDRNEVDGPAFADVMKALAKIKERGSNHWLQVSFDINTLGQSLISSQIELITALTTRWTDKQQEICWVAEEIEGNEDYPKDTTKKQELYKLVANKLDSTTAVVKKQLNAAFYDTYRQAWDGLAEYFASLDEYATDNNKSIMESSYLPYYNLGKRKIAQLNYTDALPLLEKAIKLAVEELETNNQQLIPIYICLAEAYTETSRYEKAEGAIQAALTLQSLMPKSKQYLEILEEQGRIY